MKMIELPEEASSALKTGLGRYYAGAGRSILERLKIDPATVTARGALAEAHVPLARREEFRQATGADLESFFDTIRVLLYAGEELVGSVGIGRNEDGYVVEHVTIGGVESLRSALSAIDEAPGDDEEVRLVLVPEVSFSGLAVIPVGEGKKAKLEGWPLNVTSKTLAEGAADPSQPGVSAAKRSPVVHAPRGSSSDFWLELDVLEAQYRQAFGSQKDAPLAKNAGQEGSGPSVE